MGSFVLRRIGQTLLVLLIMSFVVYGLIGLMPGDPIDIMAASMPGVTPEVVAKLKAIYGLDQPLMLRYWRWLVAALQGDLGFSRTHSQPVLEVLTPALWQTCKLMISSFVLSVVASLVFGTVSALRPGGFVDSCVSLFAFAGISVPVFWLALVLILAFAVGLHWLPAMIETLRMDFVRTAWAKGAGAWRVVIVHGLRNALIPVVTIMALSFGTLFSGALVTETMFAQQGMGKMIYDSILSNDFNLALSGLLFATLITLLSNLAADLAYGWLDPRISLK
jgi:peptide/nickel transport system permease protein